MNKKKKKKRKEKNVLVHGVLGDPLSCWDSNRRMGHQRQTSNEIGLLWQFVVLLLNLNFDLNEKRRKKKKESREGNRGI